MTDEHRFVLRDSYIYERAMACLVRVMSETKLSPGDNCWEVIIRPYKGKRSLDQNARLWAILQELSDKTGHSTSELHEICKHEFLGTEVVYVENEETCRAWQVRTPKSTTKLNIKEFSEYCDKVAMFAAQEFGVNVEWA